MLPPDPRLPLAEDPYRNPSTHIVEPALIAVVVSASKTRRFFNWLIDKVVIDRRVIYVLMAAALLLAVLMWEEPVSEWIDAMDTLTDLAITYATFFLYYALMEGLFGFTVGKLITGTRVVDAEGRRLTFARGVTCSLCRLIPFDAVSLFLSEDDVRRAWHDSITAT